MSVATLQSQLSVSSINDVALRKYFSDLCASIGASMIHDPARLRMKVEVDDSVATADVSVSLGLIVTELVINALKHAFRATVAATSWSAIDPPEPVGPCPSATTALACPADPCRPSPAWAPVSWRPWRRSCAPR
ncbi:MAG: hypothetical protein WDN45_13315 [Caulobacteraceae bacterium]